jgi:hypothetical protein
VTIAEKSQTRDERDLHESILVASIESDKINNYLQGQLKIADDVF